MQHLLDIRSLSPEEIVSILDDATCFKGTSTSTGGDHLQPFAGKHVLIVGDVLHSRVARSNLELITKLGGRVTFVAPPTLLPSALDDFPSVLIETDFDTALRRADFDAIMLLRIQAERMLGGTSDSKGSESTRQLSGTHGAGFFPSLEEYSLRYSLTNDRIARVAPEVPVLHPAPINRGLEISSEIADSKRSLINHQIRNGVFVRMACLNQLVGEGKPTSDPKMARTLLADKTVVNLFYENSTRTRFSFEAAQKRLGAGVMNFSASGSSVAKGESLKDTVTTLYAMGVSAIVIRHQNSGAAYRLATSGWVDAPVLNAGDGTHAHPTQALLDAMTLREHFVRFSQLHGTADMYGNLI